MIVKDFKVRVEMPEHVAVKEMADFIRECVSNPANPLVRMNWEAVTVTPIKDPLNW